MDGGGEGGRKARGSSSTSDSAAENTTPANKNRSAQEGAYNVDQAGCDQTVKNIGRSFVIGGPAVWAVRLDTRNLFSYVGEIGRVDTGPRFLLCGRVEGAAYIRSQVETSCLSPHCTRLPSSILYYIMGYYM